MSTRYSFVFPLDQKPTCLNKLDRHLTLIRNYCTSLKKYKNVLAYFATRAVTNKKSIMTLTPVRSTHCFGRGKRAVIGQPL
jgi:hypothetical protein